jgi:hypothetical protein
MVVARLSVPDKRVVNEKSSRCREPLALVAATNGMC